MIDGVVPVVRGIHFLDVSRLIVCFLDPRMGIMYVGVGVRWGITDLPLIRTFSTNPLELLWRFKLRSNKIMV